MQIAGDMSSSKETCLVRRKNLQIIQWTKRSACMISSSQVKRRRTLQCESEAVPVPYCSEKMPTFLEEKVCFVLYISYVYRYP